MESDPILDYTIEKTTLSQYKAVQTWEIRYAHKSDLEGYSGSEEEKLLIEQFEHHKIRTWVMNICDEGQQQELEGALREMAKSSTEFILLDVTLLGTRYID